VKFANRFQLVDVPDQRKMHTVPVPRIGGLAAAVGAAVPVILWSAADDFVRAFLLSSGILVVFGLADDLKGLGYKAKFASQIAAALIIIYLGGIKVGSLGGLLPANVILPDWFAVALSLVAIVGVTNAINLADGLDGLAGGIALLGFCCIGYLAYLEGDRAVLILSLSLAGAIFGFLRYNTHPANLFMGDTGSQLLGFSAVVLAIRITQGNTPLSPVLPLIILGFPILDTLTVMAQRLREGRSLFSPDKNHFHHRLIQFGMTHAEAVFTIYIIQSLLIVSAILFKYHSDWGLLLSYCIFSILVLGAFAAADRTGSRFPHYSFFEDGIKARLRRIRDDHWIIRTSFSMVKTFLPLLMLVSCLVPAQIPAYFSAVAACFCICLLAALLLAKAHLPLMLRLVLYLTIPFLLYLVEEGHAGWMSPHLVQIYHIAFGVIAFFVLLTVKYSRRTKGFRLSTMDYLVIFIAVVVPNLPDPSIQSNRFGLLAAEVIVLLFSYEVLLKELRKKFDDVALTTIAACMLLGVRGYMGF
jgi:UDP-GlcNAc:undecaprenyl-phosphate GlcNAc-1-phosphate transferase